MPKIYGYVTERHCLSTTSVGLHMNTINYTMCSQTLSYPLTKDAETLTIIAYMCVCVIACVLGGQWKPFDIESNTSSSFEAAGHSTSYR